MNENEKVATNLRNSFLFKLNEPVVLNKFLTKYLNHGKWQCLTWNKKKWIQILGSEKCKITFGKKLSSSEPQNNPQWEHLNFRKEITLGEMLKWEEGKTNFLFDCKTCVSHKEYWAYLDYHYLNNLPDPTPINENISWEILGFPEVKAKDSTLWIGTKGANTPCHIDTYGANIVCQIDGRKRWTLFPKNQTPYLYPTRVPFEESSIYSEAGFPYPNMDKFSNLYKTTPYVVTLEAGDVLFVPKHWWHFVENLEFSISINSWIPLPDDYHDRVKESIATYQVGSLCQSLSNISLLKSILSTNAIDIAIMSSSEMLDSFFKNIHNYVEAKCEDVSQATSSNFNDSYNLFQPVDKHTFLSYLALVEMKPVSVELKKQSGKAYDNFVKIIIKCFTDERVVRQIKNVFDENMEELKEIFS